MTSQPSDCSRSDVKQKCCNACAQHHTFTTSTDIDGQCVNKHGAGSYMCRVRWQKRHRLIQEISFMTSNNSETSSFTICFHLLTSNVRSTICYLKSVVIGRVFCCCCCFLDDLKLLVWFNVYFFLIIQGATAYDGSDYADIVCSDLQCNDPNRDNWCLSTVADDKTSCGYRKVGRKI